MGSICHVARASATTASSMATGGHQISWLSATVWVPGKTTSTATADTMLSTYKVSGAKYALVMNPSAAAEAPGIFADKMSVTAAWL